MPIRRCVCPGSYDPVTNGHLDVVRTGRRACSTKSIIAVLTNPVKPGTFSWPSGSSCWRRVWPTWPPAERSRVRVDATDGGLLVDYCRRVEAVAVVKGLRSGTDFAYELPMALMNRHLTGLETVFLPGDPTLEHVSSSLVKEVASLGGDVTGLVPDAVLAALLARRRSLDAVAAWSAARSRPGFATKIPSSGEKGWPHRGCGRRSSPLARILGGSRADFGAWVRRGSARRTRENPSSRSPQSGSPVCGRLVWRAAGTAGNLTTRPC